MMATLNSDVANLDNTTPSNIFKVTILPPFWPERPALWFSQAEAIFETAGITRDSAKYGYVVSQLPEKFAAEVEDIITNPPNEDKYQYLKSELIRRRIRQLLGKEELGDRKPTQFLGHLRAIAGHSLHNETILKQLFFRRLPSNVQNIFAGHTDLPLEKLASLADRILDVSTQNCPARPASSASTESDSSDKSDPEIEDLSRRVDALMRQVGVLTVRVLQNQNASSSRSRSRGPYRPEQDFCWYHRRWRNKAHKCIIPCAWNEISLPKRGRM